jgi:thymidylate synthase
MVKTFDGDNFDVLFKNVVSAIIRNPEHICKPRGQTVKEIIAPTLVLRNPRARLLANTARKADYGFGVGEFFWYWEGKQDVESMLYYNKRMGNFSDNGFTLNSAYGYRTRVKQFGGKIHPTSLDNFGDGKTQWVAARDELIRDNDSRRAVLMIGTPLDFVEGENSKDVPCTLHLQFFIRNNRLILHTSMRSNDVFWGLTYDLFSFTLLQELMMLELQAQGLPGLQLGEYIHTAGSLHIYDKHFEQAEQAVDEASSTKFRPAAKMEPISHLELSRLVSLEQSLRVGKVAQLDEAQFRSGVRWMAEQLNAHRRKRDAERA